MAKLPSILSPLLSTLEPTNGDADDGADSGCSQAVVLVMLYPGRDGPSFLLTVRPDHLRTHAGQVSLPGGRVEPDDSSLWAAALRETREELGMRTGRVRPLGRLARVNLQVSNFVIAPFVGWNPVHPVLNPHTGEVAEIIEVPVSTLLDPTSMSEEIWALRGSPWHVTFYRFNHITVWGATARILGDLAGRLASPVVTGNRVPGSVRPAMSLD